MNDKLKLGGFQRNFFHVQILLPGIIPSLFLYDF